MDFGNAIQVLRKAMGGPRGQFDESKHPRHPKGSKGGGKFAPKPGGKTGGPGGLGHFMAVPLSVMNEDEGGYASAEGYLHASGITPNLKKQIRAIGRFNNFKPDEVITALTEAAPHIRAIMIPKSREADGKQYKPFDRFYVAWKDSAPKQAMQFFGERINANEITDTKEPIADVTTMRYWFD